MRPCGANYENQCSSKWVAHGGRLRGTCKEGLGVKVPWVPWHSEQQHTALSVAIQPVAIHHQTCRQVADGPLIPPYHALKPPGIKAGFPQSNLMTRLSILLHINRLKWKTSSCLGWTWSERLLNIVWLMHSQPSHWNRLSAYSAVSICTHVWRYVVGFHSKMWVLIDWYFHYGCRVVWRLLICLRVLQVYGDCSRAKRKAE